MELLSPELQTLVARIASENNIGSYTLEVNKSVSKDGDGYIGILNGLSIIDKENNNTKINLVVKKAPTNENLRKQFPTRTFFLREICMYEEVIPELLKLQEEYDIPNRFQSVAKIFGYISDEFKEVLLLNNLKEDGYTLCNRQEPLDPHHLSLVITEYAKLHALSHAMKKLQPEKFEKLKDLIGGNIIEEFQKMRSDEEVKNNTNEMDMFFIPILQAVQDKPELVEAVEKFKGNFPQFMMMMMGGGATEEHAVVSHGDCWSANLLFKYEDKQNPKIPTKLCLIDWQMSMIVSPIQDLSYFFYISAGKNDLVNYMRYLHVYHTALSDTLRSFGMDPDDFYSFEVLETEWKEKSSMGFFRCLIMMQQTLSEGKTHDFEEIAKEGKSLYDVTTRKVVISDLFKQRMGDLIEFLVLNNFI